MKSKLMGLLKAVWKPVTYAAVGAVLQYLHVPNAVTQAVLGMIGN